jgi:hypothetical protein
VPPAPVLAHGSALGSRFRVAQSSTQVPPLYSRPEPSHTNPLMLSELTEAFRREIGLFAASKPERTSGFVNQTIHG